MHIETENDIARRGDDDYGRISLIIDMGENGSEAEINKCLTCRYAKGNGRAKGTPTSQTQGNIEIIQS